MAAGKKLPAVGQDSDNHLPNFGSSALLKLKNKIEIDLEKTSKSNLNVKARKPKKEKSRKEREQIRDVRSDAVHEVAIKPTSKSKPRSNGHPEEVKSKTVSAIPQASGKKRLRNGEVKNATPGQKGKGDVNSTKLGPKKAKSGASSEFDLRAEIEALGGDEEDYDLVAGVGSDSEVEGPTAKGLDGKLEKDLKSLVQGLGIGSVQYRGDIDSEDLSDADEESVQPGKSRSSVISLDAMNANTPVPSSSKAASKPKEVSKLTTQLLSEWHGASLPPIIAIEGNQVPLPVELVERLHIRAKSLLERENQAYANSERSTSSSQQFYSTIMTTGTLSDKVGALTLSVQESPLHNVKALENLIGLARKRSRAQAVEVLGALRDLFGPGNLLPSDRKLRSFDSQPGLHAAFSSEDLKWTAEMPLPKQLEDVHLVAWAYEDWLKIQYFQVLKIIETWCNDEVVFARAKAVDYVFSLLREKPEQEANLLRLLVNKLGDSDKKVASKTSFNILQLETTHPSMKPIIIQAIESDLIFRPGQSLHAQYYATITLNQTVLSNREDAVAKKLLEIYFALFLKLLETPKDKKVEATGVNAVGPVRINRKGEVQGGGGAGGKKAEKKKAALEKSTASDEDLRERMLSAVLTGVNRAIPFTNANDESFEKHLDTLFRVTHSSNFNTSIQALMLIQQLQGSSQGSADRFYRTLYESLLDQRLLTSSKQALYLNLLFRSLRADLNMKRVQAFTKRLLQIISLHQPSFTCAVIYLLRELESVFPSLSSFIDQHEENVDDDEEVFTDVREDASSTSPPTPKPTSSRKPQLSQYDGRKRDPLHACASTTTCWELHPLLHHYHPSVSLFAARLLTHSPMPPKPDLNLNTLIHFLDRFVYKNPKTSTKSTGTKGISIMQPLLANSDKEGGVLVSNTAAARAGKPAVNSHSFWKMEKEKVGVDEVFFHRYFSVVGKGKEKREAKKARKEKKKRGDDDGDGEEDDEGDEEEIWKALVGSRPEIDGDEDGGSEGLSDLEGLEDDDDDEDGEEDMPDFGDDGSDATPASDDELPDDLDEAFEAELQTNGTKRKGDDGGGGPAVAAGSESKRGIKRQRLKNLPTFASAEDYENMLGGDEEEGVQGARVVM